MRVLNVLCVALLLGTLGAASLKKDEGKKEDGPKPRIAFFPLAGSAREELRNRAWFALRAKLDRGGVYEVIDGPRMTDLAAEAADAITFATEPKAVRELAAVLEPKVLVWGELTNAAGGTVLRVKILDLRDPRPAPRVVEKTIKEATDLRFAAEEILESLPGVAKFEHPNEVAVQNDALAEELWKKNPNLVANADFSDTGAWHAIFESQYYPPPISDRLPAKDKVVIHKLAEGSATNNVLAMNLSRYCAENNGLACLSDAIKIEPDTRYRLSFRYKSDGPKLHVFVKGYVKEQDISGKTVLREIYRRQVPPTGGTNGQWVTIVDELNPQHVAFPVQFLKVDLYAYLSPGIVMFDDIVLKAVGAQTRKAADPAIKRPVTRPAGAK